MIKLSRLIDPQLASDDPRQVYFDNLSRIASMTWFSKSASPGELVGYVLGLLRVDFWKDLGFDELGFAQTHDEAISIIAVVSTSGSAVSVWAFGDVGVAKVNEAIGTEYDAMMAEMSRGEYSGNPAGAWRTALQHGEVQSEHFFTANDEVFDFINGANVVPVFDAVTLNEGDKTGESPDR